MSNEELTVLEYDWEFWARQNQKRPKGKWHVWMILAGRGYGKTRAGAETIIQWEKEGYKRIALVGQTKKDVRDIMVNGESGIIACSPPWNKPIYKEQKGMLIWASGTVAYAYSDEAPEALRGPQFEKAWVDELAKFKSLEDPERSAWENLEMGMRLGDNPQVIVTTTPKGRKAIKEMIKDSMTVVTRGSTYENIKNLAKSFIGRIIQRYEGTRLGRQELYAEVLEDIEGALWNSSLIEDNRVIEMPEVVRIVIGVDPAVTNNTKSDETGIIAGALGVDGHGYILDDKTLKDSVLNWAKASVSTYHKWKADRIIGEVNNGGDLVEQNIRLVDELVSYKDVRASKGKATRAEPVTALYEQGKIHHVGVFPELEDEMASWVPGRGSSPNRVDAMVWTITELMLGESYSVDDYLP